MSTVIQSVMAEIIWGCGEKAGKGKKPKTAELDLNSSSKVSIMVVAHRQKHTFRETLSRSTSRQMGHSVDHERRNFTANAKHKNNMRTHGMIVHTSRNRAFGQPADRLIEIDFAPTQAQN
jgi:hypothetical protein